MRDAEKQGISQRFLKYIQSLDTTIGQKALGPEQTVSGRVQSALGAATEQARAVDQQRGITRTAADVCRPNRIVYNAFNSDFC